MPSTTFNLKDPNSEKETLVYLIFRFDGQKLKYSTGQKIAPRFWSMEKQKAKESRQFPQYPEFNSYLQTIEAKINNAYRKCLNDEISPSPDILRELLNNSLKKQENANKNDLIAFAEKLTETSPKKHNTLKNYRQTLKYLIDFRTENKRRLHFQDINLNFYNEFTSFCQQKNLGTNTIGNLIKNIKVFMNEALDRRLHVNIEYKNKRFKTVGEESENIYLSTKEIQLLIDYDLSENQKLEKVRDVFVISCYTGLRYSDLVKLKKDNLTENNSKLKIQTEKTGETVVIPLHSNVKKIIAKYKGFPDYQISNQNMNEYLKELGRLVNLNEKVLISFTKGGVKQAEAFSKHELITMHTARRSFATNAYIMGIPTISIMKLTGHKTEKAFLKYIKISQEDNANKLLNHPFFLN